MGRSVRATSIGVGDTIYVYSRRRVMGSEARVRAVHAAGGVIRFDTARGSVTVPSGAHVDVPGRSYRGLNI